LTNNLLDILFMSPGMQVGSTESGNTARVSFGEETRVLLNDGFGTEAERSLNGAEIYLSRDAGSRVENPWLDTINNDDTPPEEFSITLEREPSAFSGRYFIVFNTTDKQSGISYYEVMEEPLELRNMFMWGGVDAPWKRAQSPYVLEDQSLNSTIRVRAIDKGGNEYVATLIPEQDTRTVPRELVTTAIVAFVLCAVFGSALVALYVYIRRKRSISKVEETDDGYLETNDDE
jgi:hypothetical protein